MRLWGGGTGRAGVDWGMLPVMRTDRKLKRRHLVSRRRAAVDSPFWGSEQKGQGPRGLTGQQEQFTCRLISSADRIQGNLDGREMHTHTHTHTHTELSSRRSSMPILLLL